MKSAGKGVPRDFLRALALLSAPCYSLFQTAGTGPAPAMDARKREIDQLEADIRRLEQQISAECIALGKSITTLDLSGVRSSELVKFLHSVQSLRKSEEDFRTDIARIRDTARKITDIDKAVADNEKRAGEFAREREKRFVELGAGSYTVYKSLDDRDRYRQLFEEVMKIDLEIEKLEENLRTLDVERKNGGLFEKLKAKGKEFVVRGSIHKVEKKKLKAYADAGSRAAESDFADRTTGDLRLIFDFAFDRQRTINGLRQENDRLREEIGRNRETLKQYGIEGDPDVRCNELEKRIADVRRELDVVYGWMGQLFLEKDLRAELVDNSIGAKYEIVNGVRHTISRKRGQIHRLRAEVEVEDLQKKEKALRLKRKQLEDELKVKERQIAVVDIEINAGTKRTDELRKVLTGEAPYTEPAPFPPSPDLYSAKPETEPRA